MGVESAWGGGRVGFSGFGRRGGLEYHGIPWVGLVSNATGLDRNGTHRLK